jgi:hypothetical protein
MDGLRAGLPVRHLVYQVMNPSIEYFILRAFEMQQVVPGLCHFVVVPSSPIVKNNCLPLKTT